MIELKDNRVSYDCLLLYGIIRDYSFNGVEDIKEYVRLNVPDFGSNFYYVFNKIKSLGCIEVVQSRSDGGEFLGAMVCAVPNAEPVILKRLCAVCGVAFKKSYSAKHRHVCHACTDAYARGLKIPHGRKD